VNAGPVEPSPQATGDGNLLAAAGLALVVGAGSGFVASLFKIILDHADRLRNAAITAAHAYAALGFIGVVAACGAATLLAAWLVRRFAPYASGSGIPHCEAVIRGELPPAPHGLAVVKFVGGILAMGSGQALGREGPSVQMGASVADIVSRLARLSWTDHRALLAAGAGAGLATAFNAPIAGAVFVLEELVQRFEHRMAFMALAASATAIAIAHFMMGDHPQFFIGEIAQVRARTLPLFLLLGVVGGLLGVAYNWTILTALKVMASAKPLSVEWRAGIVGVAVGVLAWFAPDLVGGGDPLTQRAIQGVDPAGVVAAILVLRFLLGPISYATSVPGGLFAPLLVLGAQSGLLYGLATHAVLPALSVQPEAFAIVGMAAFFTGVVRAPVTGIILITEMTANTVLLLPMLAACFTAMLVPTWLGNSPIYDSLREVMMRGEAKARAAQHR
jgi:CIC family chloride channel protein